MCPKFSTNNSNLQNDLSAQYLNTFLLGLVWLREQILHGGGPAWLEPELRVIDPGPQPQPAANPAGGQAAAGIHILNFL